MRSFSRPAGTIILITFLVLSGTLKSQVRPIYSYGAAGLTQALERLQTTAGALHTGAHPDDEDTAFIARTARGDHARVGYLSLNRGEGGQNIIGTELFEALGVIRTEELLQARRLDGGDQFFTRTFDYGFSKSREEASQKWNERDVLGDMVRIIRMYRPLVIYSRFSGTPNDGHGQHQLAGYLTPIAYKAASDPLQFPEQVAEGLRPWQTKKLYRGSGFRADPANPPTINVQTGVFDAVLGRTYAEIASEGRSQHKSQEMGMIELHGPQQSGLRLLESVVPTASNESSIFDGIDVTVAGIAKLAGLPEGMLKAELQQIQTVAHRALHEYEALEPSQIIPLLVNGVRATRSARRALQSAGGTVDARAEANFLLAAKEREFIDALTRAAEVVMDPLASDETVVAGSTLNVNVRTFLPSDTQVKIVDSAVKAPSGWKVEPDTSEEPEDNSPFARFFREIPTRSVRYQVSVPADAPSTQPYFLVQPRAGDKYVWADDAPKGLPFEPPLLSAEVSLEVGGERVVVSAPVVYRFADRIHGEIRRDINVVPGVTVGLDSPLLIVPIGPNLYKQRVVVRATSFSSEPVSGTLRLKIPSGWSSLPADASFSLTGKGNRTAATFDVMIPADRKAGRFEVTAEAAVGRTTYTRDVQTIAYPHIQTHRLYRPATATAEVLDLKIAHVKVGYIMGSGDQVPDALRRMAVDVTMINEEMLTTGDLSIFDTIVVGVRASEARPDFVANNGRLLQYVERGGTLIVQYQQTDYSQRGLCPFPGQIGTRVTDERAPVKILVPDHPVFTFPNRITEADFDDWIQERNLYSFTTFDPHYTPLLESADPNEPPNRGGELYAEIGKGRFVYTSYVWFRQLPAGVPGAYRMFANLISLPKAPFH
jgi:LmbE family N-acetylglucosaminyl deacetylase